MSKQLVILGSLLALDAIYIGSQYKYLSKMYAGIQNSPLKINFIGAILCYITLTFLLYYFILSFSISAISALLFELL